MKKSLGVNAMLNIIRQSISILFPLITFPYTSRVLGSIEFGKYSFSSSIISYFSLFAAFGISTYGIREGSGIRDEKEKISALASDLFLFNQITSIVSIVILCALITFNSKVRSYAALLAIQALGIVFTSVGMDWINNVYEDFLYITLRYIAIQIVALTCIFVFVRGSEDTLKYCFILVCGSYGGNLINLFYIRRYISFSKLYILQISEYIVPLLVLFINSMATTIYVNSDIIMLGIYLNDGLVGVYGFASKIYNTLKYFINAAIVVTVPRLAYIMNHDIDLFQPFIVQIQGTLSLIIFPISTGLFFLSGSIIEIVGGSEYIKGASSLQVLSLALIFALFGSVKTNCILLVNRQEKKVLTATVISAVLNVALNILLLPKVGIIGAAITTVIAEMVNLIIQSHYSHKICGWRFCNSKKELLQIIVGCLIVFIMTSLSKIIWRESNFFNHVMRIIFSAITSVLIYYTVLYLTKNRHIVKITDYLLKRFAIDDV